MDFPEVDAREIQQERGTVTGVNAWGQDASSHSSHSRGARVPGLFLTVSQFSAIGIFLFQLVSSRLSWGHGPGSQKGGSSGQFLSRDTLDRR